MKDLAIVGLMASGKTTLAEYLVEKEGYIRVSFAARLKELAATVYNQGKPIAKDARYGPFTQSADLAGTFEV